MAKEFEIVDMLVERCQVVVDFVCGKMFVSYDAVDRIPNL